jgi:hypothetical protein
MYPDCEASDCEPFWLEKRKHPLASGVRVQHMKTILGSILKTGDPWETMSIDICLYDNEKNMYG